MKKFTDFFEAYHFLNRHRIFQKPWVTSHGDVLYDSLFYSDMWLSVVKVNPITKINEDDDSLNTETRIWIEHGHYIEIPYADYKGCCHDTDLDVGGATFEEAIIKLANKVYEKHGE